MAAGRAHCTSNEPVDVNGDGDYHEKGNRGINYLLRVVLSTESTKGPLKNRVITSVHIKLLTRLEFMEFKVVGLSEKGELSIRSRARGRRRVEDERRNLAAVRVSTDRGENSEDEGAENEETKQKRSEGTVTGPLVLARVRRWRRLAAQAAGRVWKGEVRRWWRRARDGWKTACWGRRNCPSAAEGGGSVIN
ncbi:sucrose synthase 6 [Striga asiatica]|uniref:Sucrose synthase 6 n=1 Tax=Striga asiatica TaxID=4170 RepID=A0A5A7QEF5_STRAF|nr:sucrose synthase 6 [Striga asiatica]